MSVVRSSKMMRGDAITTVSVVFEAAATTGDLANSSGHGECSRTLSRTVSEGCPDAAPTAEASPAGREAAAGNEATGAACMLRRRRLDVLGESLLNETSTPLDVLADQTHIASASTATEAGCSPTRRPSPWKSASDRTRPIAAPPKPAMLLLVSEDAAASEASSATAVCSGAEGGGGPDGGWSAAAHPERTSGAHSREAKLPQSPLAISSSNSSSSAAAEPSCWAPSSSRSRITSQTPVLPPATEPADTRSGSARTPSAVSSSVSERCAAQSAQWSKCVWQEASHEAI